MNKLQTISPDRALSLVLEDIRVSDLQDTTKHKYTKALTNYSLAGLSLLSPDDLRSYCLTASGSTKSFLKAGIRRLARAIEHQAKSAATPENIDKTTALIYRSQALMESITVSKPKGEKVHTWLSPVELKELISQTRKNGNSLMEIRDRVILGLLSNAMLRRSEAVSIKFSDVTSRDGYTILEVTGKGAKTRGVKLSESLAADISYLEGVLSEGFILRAMLKREKLPEGYTRISEYCVGKSITSGAIYNLVAKYGKFIKKELQPHDLRRTGSQTAWKAGVPIEQISLALGHESLETTILYLGIERDWDKQPSDFIPY